MSGKYVQKPVVSGITRFNRTPMSEVEYSRMTANPIWALPFNAGDIVPVYYAEVLPGDTFDVSLDSVIRQTTALYPTMGEMILDVHAFFVPNRIINESWKNVQGENTSGYWSAPEVSLAPLYQMQGAPYGEDRPIQIPVGSIADYYGFPTQGKFQPALLQRCNDLKFRGYIEIYNNYYRSENYESPISYSKLNVYNGFMLPKGTTISWSSGYQSVSPTDARDGSYAKGAIAKSLYGDGAQGGSDTANAFSLNQYSRLTSFSALDKPLKANKLHDVFTSGLPSPQKGSEVYFGIGDVAPIIGDNVAHSLGANGLSFFTSQGSSVQGDLHVTSTGKMNIVSHTGDSGTLYDVGETNAVADLSTATGISVNDLRTAIATQQVYECLARGGSRYLEVIRNFFGLETENPFSDKPLHLGHIRRTLDLYQVAQTSQSVSGETPQGNLTAFGYTTPNGHLFTRTFLEHGYIHVFATVRQRNIYSSYFAPDNFRMSTLDFYLPQLANIGEQPIRLATLNPFVANADEKAIAYQEAWWEYRYEPDRVHGLFRKGIDQSLGMWTYADEFDPAFEVITGDWRKSNAEEVMNSTLATTSELAPQLKGLFSWKITKQRPMPTYSVPGLDLI